MHFQKELKNTNLNKASRGGPANPKDPYPVDEKIRQLQSHAPSCKISELQVDTPCPECVNPVIKGLIGLSHNVEKRMVALENILSLSLRYLFRSASRMQINCVYYGGQDEASKYDGIRCLDDNRIEDILVTLDQCLTCTRYEPIYGRVYEILDEEGLNAQQFMDDWQMAYLDQEEYTVLSCINKMSEDRPFADCLAEIMPQLSFEWKDVPGFKMNWEPISADSQYPDIREDIYAEE